jgi:hypothetical protein
MGGVEGGGAAAGEWTGMEAGSAGSAELLGWLCGEGGTEEGAGTARRAAGAAVFAVRVEAPAAIAVAMN